MEHGYKLRIPHDGGEPSLVDDTYPGAGSHYTTPTIGPLMVEHVADLLAYFHKLAPNRVRDRLGWQEMGLDGDKADFYVQ